jgi:ubiquitin-protein ligase
MFSPANAEAAQLYKDNTKEYERRVKVSCDTLFEATKLT